MHLTTASLPFISSNLSFARGDDNDVEDNEDDDGDDVVCALEQGARVLSLISMRSSIFASSSNIFLFCSLYVNAFIMPFILIFTNLVLTSTLLQAPLSYCLHPIEDSCKPRFPQELHDWRILAF